MQEKPFFTRGDIAAAAHTTATRVEYVVKSRGIEHAFCAAGVRLFTAEQVQRILHELSLTAIRPAAGRRGGAKL